MEPPAQSQSLESIPVQQPPPFAAIAPGGSAPWAPARALPNPVPSPGASVLDRIFAADNARKRAADERNACFVAERLACGGSACAVDDAGIQSNEPVMPQLGAAMLQRASKHRRSSGSAKAPYRTPQEASAPAHGAPTGVVPTNIYALGIPREAAQEEVELFFSKVGPISRAKIYLDADGMPKGTRSSRTAPQAALRRHSSCCTAGTLDRVLGPHRSRSRSPRSSTSSRPRCPRLSPFPRSMRRRKVPPQRLHGRSRSRAPQSWRS